MLHPYREASKTLIFSDSSPAECLPGREVFALLCGVNAWLDTVPSVQSRQGESIYILYRDAVLQIVDFWDMFSRPMARVNSVWPICAFGTAENQETIRLSAEAGEGCIQLVQQSISGKSSGMLKTLCFQIECADKDTAKALMDFLGPLNWQTGLTAASWKNADFLRRQGLASAPDTRTFFCYAGATQEAGGNDRLDSLDFAQKVALWSAFLKEKSEPVEFDWLSEEISRDALANRMEWELALREAMEQLGFHLVNQNKTFELFDGEGRRVYFGADGRRAAGRVFLKILFPLNYM